MPWEHSTAHMKCSWSHHTRALEPSPEIGGAKHFDITPIELNIPYVTPVEVKNLPVCVEVRVLSTSVNSEYDKCTNEEWLMTDFYIPGLRKCKC